ncbi:Mut7-C RNAse domain-containing protein [Halorientalis salina]|uniref:Mut7-C RNAse domain-containing protein n=1 Tax=Halorientalis salina TaxID=2932266 RepID=UPI0010ABF4F5|nr:Mut7-C RNAse domain-containing protein [Halorientalis salina]
MGDCLDGGDEPIRARDRLLLDVMLGKLATYLRMCGFDAVYALDREEEADDRLLAMARAEGRTLVTRDRGLANRTNDSVLLTARDVTEQLRELREAGFRLELSDRPARCGQCNGIVERVDGEEPTPGYAPDPGETAVWRCVDCGQCFWKGSHWDDVGETLREL